MHLEKKARIWLLFKRALAYFIDCIICYSLVMLIIQWAILSQFREQLGITTTWLANGLNMEIYVLTSISFPVWIYFSLLDSHLAKGTLGKRILKLSVTKADSSGKISFPKSFLRTILKLLPWEIAHLGVNFPTPMYFDANPELRVLPILGMALLMINTISMLISRNGQTLYDLAINTEVTEKRFIPKAY